MTQYLFVYGTLKRGGYWHHLLGPDRFIAAARLAGYACGPVFPGSGIPMAAVAPGRTLTGELYAVDEATLVRVDQLETGYARRLVYPAAEGEGTVAATAYPGRAWAYVRPANYPRREAVLYGSFDPVTRAFHD